MTSRHANRPVRLILRDLSGTGMLEKATMIEILMGVEDRFNDKATDEDPECLRLES